MNQSISVQTTIDDLRRVFINDVSDPFFFIINFTDISNPNVLVEPLKIKGTKKSKKENQITIKTTINRARAISKKINGMYSVDPTIDSYEINYPIELFKSTQISKGAAKNSKINSKNAKQIQQAKEKIEEIFNVLFLSTTQDNCKIRKDQKIILNQLKFSLGDEMSEDFSSDEDYSSEQFFVINDIKEAISILSTQYHSQAIKYLADNFIVFIQSSLIKEIDENILNDIVDLYVGNYIHNQSDLKPKKIFSIQNEIKEIFQILKKKDEKDLLIYFLVSLKMEYFNEEMLNFLFSHIDDDISSQSFSRLMIFIRQSLIQLFMGFAKQQMVDFDQIHIDCEYKEGEDLNGIISYLIREEGREILSNGTLTLTGGTDPKLNPYHPITNITEYDEKINDYFYNFHSTLIPSEESNFIDFDFGQRKIKISSYTIRSNKNPENGRYHPKTWKICGSNDKENWDIIDQQVDCNELNGPYKQHHFVCDQVKNKYRYIRYIQEDSFDSARTRSNFKYIIYLTCIEFFGEIY